jgi:hypothetical protein
MNDHVKSTDALELVQCTAFFILLNKFLWPNQLGVWVYQAHPNTQDVINAHSIPAFQNSLISSFLLEWT